MNSTVEVLTNPVPFTVNVNVAEPAVTVEGEMFVIVGNGLLADVTLKMTQFEVPPAGAGFITTTVGAPAVATSAADIAAVS